MAVQTDTPTDTPTEAPTPEFYTVRAFSLAEEGGDKLNVGVTFLTGDYTKPLSVSFSDPDSYQLVSVDWDLWARVVAAVQRASEQ